MGLNFININPIPHLTSPLKGEEQDKLAHIGLTEGQPVLSLSKGRNDDLSLFRHLVTQELFIRSVIIVHALG